MVNACPIIDRLTRPILPSGVPNGEDGKLCAANGWIDVGWEDVTGTLSNCLAKSPAVFRWSSIIDPFARFLQFSDLTVRSPAVLSVEVRRGANFFPVLIGRAKRALLVVQLARFFYIYIYTSVKIIENEVGCRDDTVPKTVETRRHCEED